MPINKAEYLEEAKAKFSAIIAKHQLGGEAIRVTIVPLSAKQAIGSPCRENFALLEGKEAMIEAQFRGSFGQAFTDQPQGFEGTLGNVQGLSLTTTSNRAIFVSTLNAVMAHLGLATGVRHCRDDEPDRCGSQIAYNLLERFGRVKVGLAGFQRAILENLIQSFSVDNVRCSDLNPKSIGSHKFRVEIWDGRTENIKLIKWSDLLLVTSSAIINSTFDDIREETVSQRKHLIMFGVTGAGISALLGFERICPFGH